MSSISNSMCIVIVIINIVISSIIHIIIAKSYY